MTETESRAAFAAMDIAEAELTPEERERRRRAGEERRKAVQAAGTYRLSLRSADGSDAVERR
jgi:hypothetical protein